MMPTQQPLFDTSGYLSRGAKFSDDGLYRYRWYYEWQPLSQGGVLWVMLNPSTADQLYTDPTVAKCVRFARSWGFFRIEVVNLFAWRSTDPRKLRGVANPVGLENDRHISQAAANAELIVVACGNARKAIDVWPRLRQVSAILRPHQLYCLGTNKDKTPVHPLYIPASRQPRPFEVES